MPLGEEADAKLLIGDAALEVRVRGSDPALRPRPSLAGAHGAADGVRRVGVPGAACRPGSPSSRTRSSPRCGWRAPSRSSWRYEASERYGYPAGFLARYFEKLRYRFGPRERAGLMTFLELAHDAGELDEVPELRVRARRRERRSRERRPCDGRRYSRRRSRASASPTTRRSTLLESRDLVAVGRAANEIRNRKARPGPHHVHHRPQPQLHEHLRTPTATSAPSTAAPATRARATCCRSRSSSRRSRRRSRSAAPGS